MTALIKEKMNQACEILKEFDVDCRVTFATVEPGIYFIPELISRWKAERKFEDFICYDRLEAYRDFGGIRIEENVVMTSAEGRILGKKRPRTIDEVETLRSSA